MERGAVGAVAEGYPRRGTSRQRARTRRRRNVRMRIAMGQGHAASVVTIT